MYVSMVWIAEGGGRSPHRSSISCAVGTTLPAWMATSASTARCLGPPSGTELPSATTPIAPNSLNSIGIALRKRLNQPQHTPMAG